MNYQRELDMYLNHVSNIANIIQSFSTVLRNSELHSYNLISNQMRNQNRNINLNNPSPFFAPHSPIIPSFSFTSNNNNNNNNNNNDDNNNNNNHDNDLTIFGRNPFVIPNNRTQQRPIIERHQNTGNNFITNLISNLTPVPIIPTQDQIINATRIIPFNEIINPVNSICPVTQEQFQPNDLVMHIRHCRHNFNVSTLQRWFTLGCRCPLCRYDIREYTNNNTNVDTDISDNSGNTLSDVFDNNDVNQEPEPELETETETETDPSSNLMTFSNVTENIPTIRISTTFDPNNENNNDNIISQISSHIRDNIITSYNNDNITGSFYIEYSINREES